MMKAWVVFFALAAVVIVAGWWWLGMPVRMPVAPLAAGEKLQCISYAPFRGDQTPLDLSTRIPASQIEDDLTRLAPLTQCVRTYSVNLGLDQITPLAQRHGLKVLQGLWLGRDPEFNRFQIETAIALANRYPDVIRAIVVGNEVLLRGELSGAQLADIIRKVKAAVPVPVTYADVWEFWLRNRDVATAVDFVTIHILPYWEDIPIPAHAAADHIVSIERQVAASFPGKEIMIGEFGWPSAGRMRAGALPSPVNQAQVAQEVIARAKQEGFGVNLIEAFDQPWKRALEGTVGGHWGVLTADSRLPKFAWGKPVSNHPHWIWQAMAGVLLAAGVFGSVTWMGPPDKLPLRTLGGRPRERDHPGHRDRLGDRERSRGKFRDRRMGALARPVGGGAGRADRRHGRAAAAGSDPAVCAHPWPPQRAAIRSFVAGARNRTRGADAARHPGRRWASCSTRAIGISRSRHSQPRRSRLRCWRCSGIERNRGRARWRKPSPRSRWRSPRSTS